MGSHRHAWEDLGAVDACWAVCSQEHGKHGRWDPDALLATGELEVDRVLRRAQDLGLTPSGGAALDFGCGVGRLTSALARRFDLVTAVDVSQSMLDKARTINRDVSNIEWRLNDRPDLSAIDDASVDLVYTNVVLQHLPSADLALAYIAEFFRVTRTDGAVIFQVPSRIDLRHRMQPRRRLYTALRALRVSPKVLYGRLGLMPMRMQAVPQSAVERTIAAHGGELLAADLDDVGHAHVQSVIYFARVR